MEFSLPRLYVVKSDNTLPTTGTTGTLAPYQFGVFLPNYTPGTVATVPAADHIFFAQGRPNSVLNLGSNKGDWIAKENVISRHIMRGSAASTVQISKVGAFKATKGGQYSILVRAFSDMLDTSSKRGYNEIFTVNGPCMNCGDDPCAELTPAQIEAMADEFLVKMKARKSFHGYIAFSKEGTGAATKIVATGVPQTNLPQNCDVWVNRYKVDAVTFDIFAQVDAPTTQDYANPSPCDVFATVEVTQKPSFPRGTYGEVRENEINYYSYTVPKFKELFRDSNFNGLFQLAAETGVVYDLLTVRARNIEKGNNHGNFITQEFTNLIYVPQAKTAAILAILEAKLGTFKDVTP